MTSNLLKPHLQTPDSLNPSSQFLLRKTLFLCLPYFIRNPHRHSHIPSIPSHYADKPTNKNKFIPLCASLSSSSVPPTSKEEAILQAKTCIANCLEKPLNNPKLAAGKIRKLRQPRFRVEIPVNDDSSSSLPQLAFSIFNDLPVRRKGIPAKILILWPNPSLTESAVRAFESNNLDHIDIDSVANGGSNIILNFAEVAVFMALEKSQLEALKTIAGALFPKPVLMFNPGWGLEEESGFGDLGALVGSFHVIYSFMGLEVRGVLSKRKGVIFKNVKDGVVSGERWRVLVEEDGNLKVISTFKSRPSIDEVEIVLYNLMAMNSPITKSAKFLKDLMSNLTGRKQV